MNPNIERDVALYTKVLNLKPSFHTNTERTADLVKNKHVLYYALLTGIFEAYYSKSEVAKYFDITHSTINKALYKIEDIFYLHRKFVTNKDSIVLTMIDTVKLAVMNTVEREKLYAISIRYDMLMNRFPDSIPNKNKLIAKMIRLLHDGYTEFQLCNIYTYNLSHIKECIAEYYKNTATSEEIRKYVYILNTNNDNNYNIPTSCKHIDSILKMLNDEQHINITTVKALLENVRYINYCLRVDAGSLNVSIDKLEDKIYILEQQIKLLQSAL